jgi:lysophospholipase L1-like esterase
MGRGRKLFFAALTVVLALGLLEGLAQLVWRGLEWRAFARTTKKGEAILRNDTINFMKIADGRYGYVLRPGFSRGGVVVNDQGFAQREPVERDRPSGRLRLIAMGESTTQGHDADTGSYPTYLRKLLSASGPGGTSVEVLNAGVAGWVSDQVALRAERELAAYRPDVVVLYVGWNDFQSYDPYGPAPRTSYFQTAYGGSQIPDALGLKSMQLLSAAVAAARQRWRPSPAAIAGPVAPVSAPETYRFFLASLDRIVAAYRANGASVQVALCTLVGRWPQGTRAEYRDQANGQTWWMKQHDLDPAQAAAALDRFNALIRAYARDHGLLLIDAARAFASLDRARLQWDFAHMHPDGYELLAEVIHRALVDGGAVPGARSPRLEALTAKYARADG